MRETRNIQTIEGVRGYIDQKGTAQLNLEDVSRGLGFTKKADSGNEVVNWTRVREYLADLGVVQKCTTGDYIPENIFYRLAMKAKNEAAQAFQAKIADEILPSIRRHGLYATGAAVEAMLGDPDTAIRLLQEIKAERDRARKLAAKVEADRPKVLFADSVAASQSCILVGELAKLLKQNGVDMGQNRLFSWMREHGYLIRRQGGGYNMPTQRAMELGLFQIKETSVTHADGHVSVNKTPKVTGKGQLYFVGCFLSKGQTLPHEQKSWSRQEEPSW